VRAGTKEHEVVRPGRAGDSELLRRITEADEDLRMPPADDPLPEDQRELIRRWIDAGAPRGEPVAPAASEAPAPVRPRRFVRSLDVVVPTEIKVPAGIAGMGPGGPLALALKVGPLPPVTALAFRGDGDLLAVGTYGQVVVWDLKEGRPAVTLADIPGPVHALAFSPDGRSLAVGAGLPARSGVARLYAVPEGGLVREFAGHADVVFAVAFRPDGGQLASAGFDQTVRLWDVADGRPTGVFTGHSDFVYDVAYAPDGRTLLSASKDRAIKRSDTETGRGVRTYSDHNDDVLALAVRPGTDQFVSAGAEPQLRWWTFDAEKPQKKLGGHAGPVHQLAFSGDGSRLISAGGDQTVRLWDGASGTFRKALPGPTEWQYAAALARDGRLAAAGGWDGLARVWDADAGTLRATLIQPPGASPGSAPWLGLAPAGYAAGSPDLLALARWRAGGVEIPAEVPSATFVRPDQFARALRGEPVDPVFAK
jgi:hypothetical protein